MKAFDAKPSVIGCVDYYDDYGVKWRRSDHISFSYSKYDVFASCHFYRMNESVDLFDYVGHIMSCAIDDRDIHNEFLEKQIGESKYA